MVVKSINDKESRFLAPVMSIWKMNLLDESSVWVVTGDIPSDYAATTVAPSTRDTARHFSLKWQMQAENLLASNDSSQKEFAKYLISRAEGLYDMFDKDELWT